MKIEESGFALLEEININQVNTPGQTLMLRVLIGRYGYAIT